jgi:hypothetical protein
MTRTDIAEFKSQLSEFLGRVEGGESVEICRRNRPIATQTARVMCNNAKRGLVAVLPVMIAWSSFACTPKASSSATALSPMDASDARATELADRAGIEQLIEARARAIARRDWEAYVDIIHPAAAMEATGSAPDHRSALRGMLEKTHNLADDMLSDGSDRSPAMDVLGIFKENDRLHALAGVEGGIPLLISFRRTGAKWMLDLPPEIQPFASRSPVRLPPKTEEVPDDVKAAFDGYASSQKLLSGRSMREYAESMHPDGLRVFQESLRSALGRLADTDRDPVEGDASARQLVGIGGMASLPSSEFYAAYNEMVFESLPMTETNLYVIGGVRSHGGIWLIVRREDAIGAVSRSLLVKAFMRKHQGVWKQDIGAEIAPEFADLIASFLATTANDLPRYRDSVESIREAGRGSTGDGAPYRCAPGVGYLFKVVGASRSEKKGYRPWVFSGEGNGQTLYVNEKDIGLCDGHLRSVSRGSSDSNRISIGLTKSGQESFAVFTERYLREPVAMMVGSEVTSAPIVVDIIRGVELALPLPADWSEERIRKYIVDLERSSRKLRGVE